MPAKITTLDTDYIIEKYASGIGIGGIADMLCVSPRPVERILIENGVHIRNRSEQQQARMDKTSPSERKRLVKAANIAMRGSQKTFETKCKMAKTLEGRISGHHVSPLEDTISQMLNDSNIPHRRQIACGAYLCDFVIDSVAVEIWGGSWHFFGEHLARSKERFMYLVDSFKGVIIVTVNASNPLTSNLIEALISHVKEMSGFPAGRGEYRMIWREGQLVTGNRLNNDNFTFEHAPKSRRNPTTGCYESIP